MTPVPNGMNLPELFEKELTMSSLKWFAEQMPGGFFIYKADESQQLLYANPAVLHIYGCSTEEEFRELTGYSFRGMVHPEDYEAVQQSIGSQIRPEENKHLDYVEYRIVRLDGSIRWVEDYGHLVESLECGEVFFVFIGDITNKHNSREENSRRVSLYQDMMEQFNSVSDDSLTVSRSNLTKDVIVDVRGKDLYPEDQIGGNHGAAVAVRMENFLNLEDRERYEETFRIDRLIDRYNQGLPPAEYVCYCKRHSGKKCFVRFSRTAVIDPVTGDVISFGIETEYNARRVTDVLNEKVLAKQYDMVAYMVGDYYGVVIGDEKNIRKGSIFPRERDGVFTEYVRRQVLPVIHGTEQDREAMMHSLLPETVREHLQTEEAYVVDVNCLIGGEVFHKRFTFYLVDKDSDFYILLKSDITDVLRKEHEMNELLINALREAEHANAAKTTFLSNMSHEIRTPMNAIVGLDSIALQTEGLSPQVRDYLEKIGASAKHLLSIINDILDMSRIESGRMILKNEEFSFSEMLEQINTMIQSQCHEKGLIFECRVIGRLDDYYIGDDMHLKQVLINILSNALKFTDAPGSVTFTIEQAAQFEDNTTLRFTIQDTGIGMEQSYLPHIFDAFSQENSNSYNKLGSTGLGMAITKNIVEMMNGNITVQSEKGVGTEFTVTVTLRNCEKELVKSRNFDPKTMRLLIVDDDEIARKHAQCVLEEVSIAAEIASSGKEALSMIALRRAKQEPYNILLIDWKMPELDGVSLTREVRARYNDAATIIILTAYNWDDIMEDAMSAGVDSFMPKPLFASNVLRELEQILQRKYSEQAHPQRAELSGRRILLAEDVEINAEIMKQLLAMRDVQVDHAENGQLVVEQFMKMPEYYYDAVLMDVRMPVMNGLEAAAAIRVSGRADAESIPIIAMTANAFDEDVQNSLQAGMNAHLSKPVETDRLFETLEKLIRP